MVTQKAGMKVIQEMDVALKKNMDIIERQKDELKAKEKTIENLTR